jgi:di/tricarboxylate transporter
LYAKDAGIIGAIYGATFFISNMVTNNAAAALLFPVALDAADKAGVDRKMMAYAVIYGASACFLSPFGYQYILVMLFGTMQRGLARVTTLYM